MSKSYVSKDKLELVCLTALSSRNLPVTAVELSVVGRKGARANWELRALSPEPNFETAEASLAIISGLQDAFDLAGNPKAVPGVLS